MKAKIVFWYPSKLSELVADEYEYDNITTCIEYLHRYGLNILIPKDFEKNKTIYIDEKMFTQR